VTRLPAFGRPATPPRSANRRPPRFRKINAQVRGWHGTNRCLCGCIPCPELRRSDVVYPTATSDVRPTAQIKTTISFCISFRRYRPSPLVHGTRALFFVSPFRRGPTFAIRPWDSRVDPNSQIFVRNASRSDLLRQRSTTYARQWTATVNRRQEIRGFFPDLFRMGSGCRCNACVAGALAHSKNFGQIPRATHALPLHCG
jgi:hypothetical protein